MHALWRPPRTVLRLVQKIRRQNHYSVRHYALCRPPNTAPGAFHERFVTKTRTNGASWESEPTDSRQRMEISITIYTHTQVIDLLNHAVTLHSQ